MPNDTYMDKAEISEGCKCKNPLPNDNNICLNCGGKIESIEAPEFGLWRGSEIYNHKYETKPLIEGIINQQDFVLIQSEGGVGKSGVAQQMKFNLTTGEAFLGIHKIHGKQRVLWCMGESTKGKHIGRLKNMKKAVSVDDNNWWFYNCSNIHLNRESGYKTFCDSIEKAEINPTVIFLDSLYCFFSGSFSDDDETKNFVNNLREFAGKYKATVICLHHTPKDSFAMDGTKIDKGHRPIGSTFWDGFFTTTFKLVKRNTGLHYLVPGKDRDGDTVGDIPMYMVKPQEDRAGRYFFTQDVDKITNHGKTNEFKVMELFKSKARRYPDELFYAKNDKQDGDPRISKTSFYSIIHKLVNNGTVDQQTDEHGHVVYVWKGGCDETK